MLNDQAPGIWTIGSLSEALGREELAGEIAAERIEGAEPVLIARMLQHGDLPIFVSLAGEQIVVSTLLWPVDEQQEPVAWGVSVSVVMAFSSSQAHVV